MELWRSAREAGSPPCRRDELRDAETLEIRGGLFSEHCSESWRTRDGARTRGDRDGAEDPELPAEMSLDATSRGNVVV